MHKISNNTDYPNFQFHFSLFSEPFDHLGVNKSIKIMYDIIELSRKLLPDLKEIAKELDIKKIESFKKQDLIYKIL